MNLNELEQKIAELKSLERQASIIREELGLPVMIEKQVIPETCCEGKPPKELNLQEFLSPVKNKNEWVKEKTVHAFNLTAQLTGYEKVQVFNNKQQVIKTLYIEYFENEAKLKAYLTKELCNLFLAKVWSNPETADNKFQEFKKLYKEAKVDNFYFSFYKHDETPEDVFWTWLDM